MIRRNPTLIALNDTDVQQVRSAIAKRKTKTLAAKPGASTTEAIVHPTTLLQPFVAVEDSKRKREAMTRDERLGLR
ncbi:hypothetical protein A0H81_11767 [Grifola frondosa]|uniref:Uncharacterized protein n=1 Tax=Grifola frondosa TaxID=5627 RepID=A0A1C7LU03_GRIFR|nr:hypothetical protein A0H81_11767 [Grifola frondosa]